MNRSRYNGLLCALIVGICPLLTSPFFEMGISDDWSYIRTAQVFAQTGHIVYNGWATAMLGWQIYWGALFVKLFGFSFTALHLSNIPIAMASAWLFYEILRGFGVSARNASFGTLTLGLLPISIFSSIAFMSDVPGLFCILLCLYCCQRALFASTDMDSVMWLVAAAVSNTALGTVRQIAWLGVLVMVPSAAWLLRKRRGVLPVTAILWLAGAAAIHFSMKWFQQQPYSIPEPLIPGHFSGHILGHMAKQVIETALSLFLFSLPILISWIIAMPRKMVLGLSALLAVVGIALYVAGGHHNIAASLAPWLGTTPTARGIADFPVLLGNRSDGLNLAARIILTLAALGAVAGVLYQLIRGQRQGECGQNRPVNWQAILTLTAPFLLAYFGLLLPRAGFQWIYDRYLLGPLVILILWMLLFYQERISGCLSIWSSVVLLIFAVYGIAGIHDFFALDRARLEAVARIRATGVPVTSIEAGIDFDGWTQITTGGYLNDPRLRVPAGSYHAPVTPENIAPACRYWFLPYTPVIHPDYTLVFSLMPCLAPSGLDPVAYKTWLPPLNHRLYIQKAPAH